jgi:putative transposase
MAYSTGGHTRFYHRFHVVWVTKYRYKVLEGAMRERIREIIRHVRRQINWAS